MSIKRIIVGVLTVTAFFAGYGVSALAYPTGGVHGRAEYRGYFTNTLDGWGTFVLPAFASYGGNALPPDLNNADEFINYIKYTKLDIDNNGSGNAHERTGAAFIIHTMIGTPATERYRPPNGGQLADWEERIRAASREGRIDWYHNHSYTLNSYYQATDGPGPGGQANPNDAAFFDESGTSTTIIFRDSSNRVAYALRRQCANPVGTGTVPEAHEFTVTGRTTVNNSSADITINPGQSLSFRHYVRNAGPTSTSPTDIWWVGQNMPSQSAAGGPANSGEYSAGQEKLVHTETFPVPNNAASGTQYCRRVGWDPVNHAGARNGRGATRCATVVIPAKLKAAMSVAPPTMAPGDSATFTPVISSTNNGDPITVNCTITRTLYPPTGGSSSLGNQPCVDGAGNANILIGTGATVPLRNNNYNSLDTVIPGSRVCDVITITNPSGASYYQNFPADQTATACVTIAKSPYVHFIGDVWAGGGFAAVSPGTCANNANITTVTRSRTVADGTTPGSGTTYAAFALGKITTFGSASMALVTSTGLGDAWTFSNQDINNLGFFGAPGHCIEDYVDEYQSAPVIAPGLITVSGVDSGAWRVNGNASFQGTPMTAGAQKVYFINGDATILGDIRHAGSFTALSQIPSLVIIATGNIYLESDVTQLDGIFITRGTFYTCWPKTEPATVGTCNQRLTINGAVRATAVDLFRTAGAEGATPAAQKDPAEIFNLSPEVFLRNSLNATTQTVITTNSVRELPPRF